MSMYSIKDLLTFWSQEKLSVEQAIGHILQNLFAYFTHLNQLERRLQALEQQAPNTNL